MALMHYTLEEQHAALKLAARIGTAPAAQELGIARSTINRFKHWNPELWSDLMADADVAPRRRQRQAEDLEDLADAYVEREFAAVKEAERLLASGELNAKEVAALIKAMGSSRGLATVGSRAHRGEDAQVIEHNINFAALERAAEAILARAPDPSPILVENLEDARDDE